MPTTIESLGRFLDKAWEAGDAKPIESVLERHPDVANLSSESFREHILLLAQREIELKRRSGIAVSAAEYAERFPVIPYNDFADLISLPNLPDSGRSKGGGLDK